MKKTVFTLFFTLAVLSLISSCAVPREGCPMNASPRSKYKG
ncbi:MAG: hypothetical protein ACO3AY_08660 [Chitinophagaceae bacterium]